jgi:NhaP-type Na+/H+ or K+/H+ antiporter
MNSNTRRELLTGLQYLLIGIIAEGAALRWFSQDGAAWQLLVWISIALGLSIVRFLVLFFSDWWRTDQGMSISRRRWDEHRD